MLFEHFTKSFAKPPLMTFQNRKDRRSVDREFRKTILNGEQFWGGALERNFGE